MDDSSPEARAEQFDEAVRAAEAWGRRNGLLTGMWLNRRRRTVGVGITDGDEIETTEALRALVPAGIRIRTRVASPRLAELWQLQEDVDVYLEDEHIWERWGASLGVDAGKEVLQIGLLPDTPDDVVAAIEHRFSGSPIVVFPSGRARAL